MKIKPKKDQSSLHLDKNYKNFLTELKEQLKTAQIRAALAANNELIKFYWQLGTDLIEKQKPSDGESIF